MPDFRESPGVFVPPPVIFTGGFLTGMLLDRLGALPRYTPLTVVGSILLAAAALLALWALVTFLRHRTAILPHHRAAVLVRTGPYRFTRNPMYLALTTAYVGLALDLGRLGPLLLLAPTLWALVSLVVVREEQHLTARFGADYTAYRAEVRRWL